MNLTIKDLQTSLHSAFSFNPLPRKIKITSKFNAYLDTVSIKDLLTGDKWK